MRGKKLAEKYVFGLDFFKFIASRTTDLKLRNDIQFSVKKRLRLQQTTLSYTAIKDTGFFKSNADTLPPFIMDQLHAVNMVCDSLTS